MIDPSLLKSEEGAAKVRENLAKRRHDESPLKSLEELTAQRSRLISSSEALQNKRKTLSKEVGALMKQDPEKAEAIKGEVQQISGELETQKSELAEVEANYTALLLTLPNMVDGDIPEGDDESQNREVRTFGEIPSFPFEPVPHYEAKSEEGGELFDFERGVKLSGSRFYVYNERVAKLERELIRFMLTTQGENGYSERYVPFIVGDEALEGTGQLPKFADDLYRLPGEGLNLIPTAEVSLTNLYRDEILSAESLPIRLMASTPCFRREAGSAGKDTRGILRVHQFQKVELVIFSDPSKSSDELEKLTSDAESVLKKLGLTYRVVLLCSGDIGFSAAKTYDLEVWMPGMKRWLEVSSCSNVRDFQARRAKIRYKNPESGKNEPLHTLNGSGLAAGRVMAALLEYHQKEGGVVDWEAISALF